MYVAVVIEGSICHVCLFSRIARFEIEKVFKLGPKTEAATDAVNGSSLW